MQTISPTSGHLILSRRAGESLRIGSQMEVLILAIGDEVIRLEIASRDDSGAAPNPNAYSRLVSCRLNESVFLATGVELCVSQIRGQQVRIAIRAPLNMLILRSELAHA